MILQEQKEKSMDDPLSIWDSRYAQKEKNTISSKYDYWMNRWEFLLQRQKREIALDIGCGIGLDTKYLTEMGYTVISGDISGEALSICRQELPDNTFIQLNLNPWHGNCFSGKLSNRSRKMY
jgi:2-polyprenyl-3-methyl-5-hydroxy-6-metoxy-1,4-benzoquinol methylase